MNRSKRRGIVLTPEKTQAWGLALIPLAIIFLVTFMVVTRRPITTDVIGLFIGLLTAGSLQAAVQKKGQSRGDTSDSDNPSGRVRRISREELDTDDWRRSNDSHRRRLSLVWLYSNQMEYVSGKIA